MPNERRGQSGAAGREAIAAELLADRPRPDGYPLEVLKLELDLEADLGIDSIKRVEILGKLRDSLPGLGGARLRRDGHLARARTLGAIVDRVERILGPIGPSRPARSRQPAHETVETRLRDGTAPAAPGRWSTPRPGPRRAACCPGASSW